MRMHENHFTLDQAVAELNKRTSRTWQWRDLMKEAARREIELLCYANDLPLSKPIFNTRYEEEVGTVGETVRIEIECFTGFFNASLTDDGLKYIHALAHGEQIEEGIQSIERDGQFDTIADLKQLTKNMKNSGLSGLDCGGLQMISTVLVFEYVPHGDFKPSPESFYIERHRLDYLINNLNYHSEGAGYSFGWACALWESDREKWGLMTCTEDYRVMAESIRESFKHKLRDRAGQAFGAQDVAILEWVINEIKAMKEGAGRPEIRQLDNLQTRFERDFNEFLLVAPAPTRRNGSGLYALFWAALHAMHKDKGIQHGVNWGSGNDLMDAIEGNLLLVPKGYKKELIDSKLVIVRSQGDKKMERHNLVKSWNDTHKDKLVNKPAETV